MTTCSDSVAGRVGSSAGNTTCAVMSIGSRRPPRARTARARSARAGPRVVDRGSSRCESVSVSPCPGKCLPHASMPARVEAARERERRARHGRGVVPERAVADDRIRRVRVDVEHRREVDVEAERAQLVAERAADLLGGARVVGRQPIVRHHRRPHASRARARAGRARPPDRSTPAGACRRAPPHAGRRPAWRAAPDSTMFGRNSITPPTSPAAIRAWSSLGRLGPSKPTESSCPASRPIAVIGSRPQATVAIPRRSKPASHSSWWDPRKHSTFQRRRC